jgi:uncharacterized membrane protein YqjE
MADVVSGRPGPVAAVPTGTATPTGNATFGVATPESEPSVSELVQRATDQVSRLIRDELELARVELTEKGKHAGVGVGLFGGGGALALYGIGTLIAAVVLVLGEVMPYWGSALVVAVVLFAIAGVLALLGRNRVRRAAPPTPQTAAESVRADVETVKAAVRERGSRA